ncbi:hypothetical protein [Candidatus Nitrospira bockiana]
MSGKLHRTELSAAERVLADLLLSQPDADAVPEAPPLLTAVVRALLARLERVSPADRRDAQHLIALMSAAERFEPLKKVPELQWKLYEDVFMAIALGQAASSGHNVFSLKLQKIVLANYLRETNPYPQEKRFWRRWIKESWSDVLKRLERFPCWCNYDRELTDDSVNNLVRKWNPRTDAQILYSFLAHLHNTTPENIKRELKQAAR